MPNYFARKAVTSSAHRFYEQGLLLQICLCVCLCVCLPLKQTSLIIPSNSESNYFKEALVLNQASK